MSTDSAAAPRPQLDLCLERLAEQVEQMRLVQQRYKQLKAARGQPIPPDTCATVVIGGQAVPVAISPEVAAAALDDALGVVGDEVWRAWHDALAIVQAGVARCQDAANATAPPTVPQQ